MKKGKRGFTLVEVALFLAVSGLLFLGVTAGVQTSIYQQRRTDAVQNFMEFLRGVYGEVTNVQNTATGGGRSSQVLYGRLVTFGEKYDLAGNETDGREIFVYSVVGKASNGGTGGATSMLSSMKANIVAEETDGSYKLAGFTNSYTPKWSAQIDGTTRDTPMEGMLLIVRHPTSGTVFTFFTNKLIQVNQLMMPENDGANQVMSGFSDLLNEYAFKIEQVDFCVNTDVGNTNALRSDVRIANNSRGASGVELVGERDEDDKCNN